MGNIIDYVKEYGKYSVSEKEFNDVDSLVLSQFSYLKFDGLVPELDDVEENVTVRQLDSHENRENLFADERYRDVNTQLFQAMAASRRFGEMGIHYHENIIDEIKETQFSAVTFLLEGGLIYIAYRGTDETIIGWKEDFNMAFSKAVTGQLIAVKYLNHVSRKFLGSFLVGGHSKGGNFAVYAAMKCDEEVKKRIQKVYSHDGPGFRPELLESNDYESIEDRVCKILPRASLVGMLLQNQEDYFVVESKSMGMMQHNPYKWQIKNDDFVRVKDIYQSIKLKDEALNEWILTLDEEHLHLFVDTLFEIIAAAKVDNLIDFTAEWKNSSISVLNAIKEIDPEAKKILRKIIGKLLEITSEKVKESVISSVEAGKKGRINRFPHKEFPI